MTNVLSVLSLAAVGFGLALMLGSYLGMLASDRILYALATGFGFAVLAGLCLAWEGQR